MMFAAAVRCTWTRRSGPTPRVLERSGTGFVDEVAARLGVAQLVGLSLNLALELVQAVHWRSWPLCHAADGSWVAR